MVSCLGDELDGLLQGDVIGVVLLQQVLGSLSVGANGGCLPAAIVAAGIALIQLESPVFIPARSHAHLPLIVATPWQARRTPLICGARFTVAKRLKNECTPAAIEQGYTKRTQAAKLRVALFVVT